MLVGVAGTLLPALPGTLFVLAGIVLGAWIDDFTRIGWGSVAAVTVLAVLAWGLDFVAGLLGAQRVGASRQAIVGAVLGTVAGMFLGLVGAAVGEYLAQKDHRRAVKVGLATWLGMTAGLIAKVVITFMMVSIFVAALLT
jgi:uncharacterized protein YqgC (DUF456 family)